MKQKIGLCVIALVLALPAAAQKKSGVKVNYDKFKDITCASIYIGNVAPSLASDLILMDASYCSRGRKLEAPTVIELRLISKAWLGGIRDPRVIFLLDGTERLTLAGSYSYAAERILGDVGQITLEPRQAELLHITSAKLVEFQVLGSAYKLKQKDLAKLKDLAQSGSGPNR